MLLLAGLVYFTPAQSKQDILNNLQRGGALDIQDASPAATYDVLMWDGDEVKLVTITVLGNTFVDVVATDDVTAGDDLVVGDDADIDGDIDVDGTANLDVVDIDGAVQIDNTVTVGVDGTGYDIKFFGATASNYFLWDESEDRVSLVTTSPSTSGGTSIRPFYMQHTMTGIGGVGGRAEFLMSTNVALGSWSNALKGIVEYGAAGRTVGLGSAIVGELSFGIACTTGTYAPLESELVANVTTSTGGASVSFFYMNIAGTDGSGVTDLNTNGYFFEIGAGITDQAGGIFEAEAQADIDATHVLKCKIDGVTYYIPLNTAKTF